MNKKMSDQLASLDTIVADLTKECEVLKQKGEERENERRLFEKSTLELKAECDLLKNMNSSKENELTTRQEIYNEMELMCKDQVKYMLYTRCFSLRHESTLELSHLGA